MIEKVILLNFMTTLAWGHKQGHHSYSHSDVEQGILGTFVNFCKEFLFPFNARYNSLLATLIIQLLPCLIIYWIPGMRKLCNSNGMSGSLNLLVAFAMGTLLGDIFLHLLPEIFSSIDIQDHELAHQQYVITGSAICAGYMIFFVLEKTLGIIFLGADQQVKLSDHSHSHSHSHSRPHNHGEEADLNHSHSSGHDTATQDTLLKKRKEETPEKHSSMVNPPPPRSTISVYLNIISGFIHNITDGIAIASSFYSSKHVGVTTTIAIMFHEIPHELGDFAILTSNGFTFTQAFKSQLINAVGSLTGTAIGCALNEITAQQQDDQLYLQSLLPQCAQWSQLFYRLSNLRLSLTTGGFLYLSLIHI